MAAQLEAERKEYETQLELVDTSLQDDPQNEELLALRTELVNCIQLLDDSLAELKSASAAVPAQNQEPLAIGIPSSSSSRKPSGQGAAAPAPAAEEPPKWSRENHPAFKKPSAAAATTTPQPEKEEAPAQVNYQVNDTVMARWLSGDKGFYPAKIVSVTGSSTAPIYTVKFKSYDTVETLRAKDIKPMASSTTPTPGAAAAASSSSTGASASAGFKRKAADPDTYPIPSSIPASSAAGAAAMVRNSDGITLSAGPELYPGALAAAAAAAAEEAGGKGKGDSKFDKDGKPKFKKIKANKELEKGKNKWQEFTAKGKFGKGATKKESMFRTPEGVHGRVGFTGSGQAMRKDPTRSRHIYQPNEDLD
ncbi:uncharacterized protein B0T23DRAFT_315596 [Neurospora hispaniola]|uniref:Tudor domain-containing protein n=1 Tax=Neurospora hispaniola TaxID=588809 RepID=A0AAJ0MRN7_9PEZI|nr:hypothetical protein B0T23DRAFT_315596 [Neurospora hispaniola]